MKILTIATIVATLSAIPTIGYSATSPILDALSQQGVNAEVLKDKELKNVRGAAVLFGQPLPSMTSGIRTNYVAYKGWGSTSDYLSYNWVASSESSGNAWYAHEGWAYPIVGDSWRADDTSGPHTYNAANSHEKEHHYQILNGNGSLSDFAFRVSHWNRPISTFTW
jgi:hypothetical protein